ncbi:MAG: hypothetical protein N0A15_08150, partial [Anaerolineae bacterium]|nr:hypothetical protein [Anaerolineae bacterium]
MKPHAPGVLRLSVGVVSPIIVVVPDGHLAARDRFTRTRHGSPADLPAQRRRQVRRVRKDGGGVKLAVEVGPAAIGRDQLHVVYPRRAPRAEAVLEGDNQRVPAVVVEDEPRR